MVNTSKMPHNDNPATFNVSKSNICNTSFGDCVGMKNKITDTDFDVDLDAHAAVSTPKLSNLKGRGRFSNQSSYQQTAINTAFDKMKKFHKECGKFKSINSCLLKFIIKDNMPLSIVDSVHFKALIAELEPRFEPYSRKTLTTKYLPKMYLDVRDKVQNALQNASYFSITTDMWTSRNHEDFISLTHHTITDDWILASTTLEVKVFGKDHTADFIKTEIESLFQEWGLDNRKLTCATTDRGSNINKGMEILKAKNLPCFGHVLHCAVVAKAFEDHNGSAVLTKCNSMSTFFHHSTKAIRVLHKAFDDCKLSFKKPPNHSPTR